MRTEERPASQLGLQEQLTAGDVRIILFVSLVLAVLGVVGALNILSSSSSIYEIHIFFHQFVVHDLSGSILCGLILILAMVQFRWSLLPMRVLDLIDRYRWAVAATITGLLAVGTLTIYHNYTLCMDEYAQLFQAKLFATGKIWAEYPPELLDRLLPFTNGFFALSRRTGHVISDYWPGYSLLQTPFVLIGASWLLNPLLGAGTLLLIRHIAAKLYPDSNAPSWAMLFTLASPAFIVNSISYYSLPAQLFLNLLFTALILDITPRRLVVAGFIGALSLLQKNPVPHIFYALPWLVWIAIRRGGWRSLIWLIVGYLPLSLLIGVGWAALRVHLATQGPMGENTLYGEPWRLLSVFSVGDLLTVITWRSIAFLKIVSWAVPGLIVFAALGARRGWKNTYIRVLTSSAILTFIGYFLFKVTQGHGWGYRHFHSVWGTLPLLACGLVAVKEGDSLKKFTPLACTAGILIVLSFVLLNGLRLYQADAFIDRHLAQLPALHPQRKQVCFIRPDEGYYSIDLIENDPFLQSNILFIKSSGPEDEKQFIEKYYPDAVPRSNEPDERIWYID